MRAVEVAQTGGPEVLQYVDRPMPAPGPDEVLIKADAIGVNYIDTYFRSGQYPRELPFVVGTEVCGTVAAAGDDVAAIKVGDRVVTANATGAYAEYCCAPADFVAYVPESVPSDAISSALLKGMTAHYLIKSVYQVQPRRLAAGARRRRRGWPDPDPVGDQPRRTGDHHRLDTREGRTVPAGRRGRGARLPRRSGAVRCPRSRSERRTRSGRRLRRGGQDRHSTPAWPAWPSGAHWPCSAPRVDRCRRWTRSDSTPPVRYTSPGPTWRISSDPPTNSPGAPGSCIDAIADDSITITVGGHYPLAEVQRAHAGPAGQEDDRFDRAGALSGTPLPIGPQG